MRISPRKSTSYSNLTRMDKHYGYIYKIVCKISGKPYIGQTTGSLKTRLRCHFYDSKKEGTHTKIGAAFRKYGRENFEIFPVCWANSKKDLDDREAICIKLFDSIKNGYNIRPGGNGSKQSEESKKKMSMSRKGKKKPEGFGEKISNALRGKKHSESHRRNNVLAQINCQDHKDYRHSEESKRKISIGNKGKIMPPEFGKGVSQRNRDRGPTSEETKKKMSIKRQGRKPNQRPIICLNTGVQYPSVKSAADTLKISIDSLGKHLKGKLKTATGGRIFKYV